jgi:uncharacterized membrane protein YcgQ (UPF0703/DUF1980 family)
MICLLVQVFVLFYFLLQFLMRRLYWFMVFGFWFLVFGFWFFRNIMGVIHVHILDGARKHIAHPHNRVKKIITHPAVSPPAMLAR